MLRTAIQRYKRALAVLNSIEHRYAVQAPELDRFPAGSPYAARLRRLESELNAATKEKISAEREIIACLDRAELTGTVAGSTLFIAADIQPESIRRLVVVPVGAIAGGLAMAS